MGTCEVGELRAVPTPEIESSFLSKQPEAEPTISFAGRMWKKVRSLIYRSNDVSDVKEGLAPHQIRSLRQVVEKVLQAKEYEKLSELVPFFSEIPLPNPASRLKDTDVVTTYSEIQTLAARVFTSLPEDERGDFEGMQAEEIVESPDLFLTLLQTSSHYSLGCLSKKGEAASFVERGVLIKNLLSMHLEVEFPDAILASRANLACVPGEIEAFSQTKILDLSENNLQCLPPKLHALKSLKQLNLSKNNLHTLPAEIGTLDSLEMLDLSFNPLKKFPSKQLKSLSNLQVITLDETQQKKFSRALRRFLTAKPDCKIEIAQD